MKIDFLGCSGGIEGSTPVGRSLNDYARSTCYRINDRVLIDAGTGAGRLGMSEMVRIEHVLLTHAHLDHVACLPLMIDTIAGLRKTPTRTWGLPGVLTILRDHILNDAVWPDFTTIPSAEHPFLTLHEYPEPGPSKSRVWRSIRSRRLTAFPPAACWYATATTPSLSPAIRAPTLLSGRRRQPPKISPRSSSSAPTPTARLTSRVCPSTCMWMKWFA